MEQYTTPILFIIFNRIETTRQVFDTIKALQPKFLFIAADGPRPDVAGELYKCTEVRDYVLNNIDWHCEVKTHFSDLNQGCGYGPATAISWFFENVDEGIILEDDCLPDSSFFEFCSLLLEKYRYDNRIGIISGSNFDRQGEYHQTLNDYFFSAIPYTWGWATWKRNWVTYDYTIKAWGKCNRKSLLENLFVDREFQLAWKKVFDDIYNSIPTDIWDYQFFFLCFLKNQLSIVPSVNLISNIGHEENATHTFSSDSLQANVPLKSIQLPIRHPAEIERDVEYDIFLQELCFGRIEYVPVRKQITRFLKRVLKKRL